MAGTELIDIVDEQNVVCGSADAATAHEQKLRHRVVGVFLFDSLQRLYLQKGGKYGKLDLSVGGHVHRGESYNDAARREMQEELDIDVPLQHVVTFLPEHARMNHFWAIYTATVPDDWIFLPTPEVSAIEKMDIRTIKELLAQDSEAFTHGFVNTFQELVRLRGL